MRCTVRRVPPRCRLPPAAVHAAAGPNCAQCGQDQEIVAHSDSPDATPDKFPHWTTKYTFYRMKGATVHTGAHKTRLTRRRVLTNDAAQPPTPKSLQVGSGSGTADTRT